MKALSIRQPWAWAVFNGKDVENRDWRTRYRGRVLVHAGQKEDADDLGFIARAVFEQTRKLPTEVERAYWETRQLGAIVGAVTITGCVETSDSPWFFGRYGFVLANPRAIEPIKCKGKLGFFDVPPEVADEVRRQAEAA